MPLTIDADELTYESDLNEEDVLTGRLGDYGRTRDSAPKTIIVKELNGDTTTFTKLVMNSRPDGSAWDVTYAAPGGYKLRMIAYAGVEYEDDSMKDAKMEAEVAKALIDHWDELMVEFPGLEDALKGYV